MSPKWIGQQGKANTSSRQSRRLKKLLVNTTWFKTGSKRKDLEDISNLNPRAKRLRRGDPDNRPPDTVPFVKRTPNGDLVRQLKDSEAGLNKILKTEVKIVGRSGISLSNLLTSNDPWLKMDCDRKGFSTCSSGECTAGTCWKRSVVYEDIFKKCSVLKKTSKYITIITSIRD